MTPHKQRFGHDPENGVYGDCERTVLACLLDLEPEEVPHFGQLYWNDMDAWNKGVRDFLEARGLRNMIILYDCSVEMVLQHMQVQNPDLYYRMAGDSGVYSGVDHVVICLGDKVIHDTSGSGVVGPSKTTGYVTVEILVPLSLCV